MYRDNFLVWVRYLYNIASRAAQSNSVYISVLKIMQQPLLARGKIPYFASIMNANRDLGHQSQNEDNFPTFCLGLEFLNEAEKEKNDGGDSASPPSCFASLSESEVQQILTDRHCGKTKQMTNWSDSTFKGRLKFFRFKIVKYKTNSYFAYISLDTNNPFCYSAVFRIIFDEQFHQLCYKTIGSCF